MSGSSAKPEAAGLLRQALALCIALGLFAATAVIVLPKLQSEPTGLVRVELTNAMSGSMLEFVMNLHMPEDAMVGPIPATINAGETVTVYEGVGPIRFDSLSFVASVDGAAIEWNVGQSLDPGGLLVLTVTAEGVGVDLSTLDARED